LFRFQGSAFVEDKLVAECTLQAMLGKDASGSVE
jgi:hypothetical protein